ncbi:MAG TPA: hypothetical protein VGM94_10710 [Galbitalea sp.]|jgi:hypothetical protein
MKNWWRRISAPTRVFVFIASAAFVVDVALLILAQTGRIGFGLPAAIGVTLCVLIVIGVVVAGRMNSRRELDDIVRRVDEQDEERGAD